MTATAFAHTFYFFATHQATAHDKANSYIYAMNVNRFVDSFVQTSEDIASYADSGDAHNKKINANFLFGGFIASYESWCVIKQLCFVSTVVRKLPQIKNFVYPLCVIGNQSNKSSRPKPVACLRRLRQSKIRVLNFPPAESPFRRLVPIVSGCEIK